ncbi:AAA family ATPase [Citrobacter freundii]|uniref:AAA family ATPase n=2 Tax=Citrobacter freundii TaxID=546 RepID=UPI00350F9B6A
MTPIQRIADWSQRKPVWWKHALRLSLVNGKLDQDNFDSILKIAYMEHGLLEIDEIYMESAKPIDFKGYTAEQYEVSIRSLYDVKGVGLLAENQKINFANEGLFIVYGDNGAGKSSYASILKNTCLTRGECPQIMGNIFSKEQISPQAKISVSCNGQDETYAWDKNTPSIEALKSIRVFDSSSASHYVNKEDALGFRPIGLNLLAELVRAVNSVKSYIDEDLMPGNGLIKLAELNSSSITADLLSNLSAETSEDEVSKHIATPDELQNIEPLRVEILQYKSQTAETIRNTLQQNKAILTPLKIFCDNALKLLDDKALDALQLLKVEKERTETLSEELRKATLNSLPLENIAGLSWQKLWQAAKLFIEQEEKEQNFPMIKGEYCPLCLQEVGEESEVRMASLNQYINNQTAKDAKLAKENYDNAIKSINSLSLTLTPYLAAITFLNKHNNLLGEEINSLFSALESRKKILTGVVNLPQLPINVACVNKLKDIIGHIDIELLSVSSDEELLALIAKKEAELLHLEDKKYVSENIDSIISNIRRYKRIKSLESIQSQCVTTSISTLSASINRSGVVEPLISAFDAELKSFGFDRFKIKVDSRNRSGVQQFRLSLADENDNVIGALGVASEGEQRCIAIASFLAEMIADSRKSAVIFDDPVNSLSHEWSRRVAKRLVLESKNRQVIVLTHNIVFYKLLLEVAEGIEAQHSSIALERSRRFAGLVRESAPWEAMTTRSRYNSLKVMLQELKRLDKKDETTGTEFRDSCYRFYGSLRETWERLVEEKLLNKVVTRFERGVSTQRLARLVDICQEDIDKVDMAMTKCSTYFRGHDSAAAVGDPYPTIEEVEEDLNALFKFLTELEEKPRKRT